jgi:Arc/MetJ-type ribon-helix-helix transcriptional regulator
MSAHTRSEHAGEVLGRDPAQLHEPSPVEGARTQRSVKRLAQLAELGGESRGPVVPPVIEPAARGSEPALDRWLDRGMITSMTRYEKIAITLPLRAAENVRRAVRAGKAPSVSAYIAAAVEERTNKETLRDLLNEMLAETGGPTTPAERRQAEIQYGVRPRPTKRRTKQSTRPRRR